MQITSVIFGVSLWEKNTCNCYYSHFVEGETESLTVGICLVTWSHDLDVNSHWASLHSVTFLLNEWMSTLPPPHPSPQVQVAPTWAWPRVLGSFLPQPGMTFDPNPSLCVWCSWVSLLLGYKPGWVNSLVAQEGHRSADSTRGDCPTFHTCLSVSWRFLQFPQSTKGSVHRRCTYGSLQNPRAGQGDLELYL